MTARKADYKTVEVITASIDNKTADVPKPLGETFQNTNWGKSHDYFHILPHEEPHARRRKAIRAKYGK